MSHKKKALDTAASYSGDLSNAEHSTGSFALQGDFQRLRANLVIGGLAWFRVVPDRHSLLACN